MRKWVLVDISVRLNGNFENEIVEIYQNRYSGELKTVVKTKELKNEEDK